MWNKIKIGIKKFFSIAEGIILTCLLVGLVMLLISLGDTNSKHKTTDIIKINDAETSINKYISDSIKIKELENKLKTTTYLLIQKDSLFIEQIIQHQNNFKNLYTDTIYIQQYDTIYVDLPKEIPKKNQEWKKIPKLNGLLQ